jgi:thiosulfate dehydrogenase
VPRILLPNASRLGNFVAHERPQDPRFSGSVEATRKKYHDSDDSLYGRTVNGHLLGGAR